MSAHISYLGISGSPIRAREVENILVGSKLDEQTLEQAGEVARSYVSNDMEDVHATVDYRCALTTEITKRVFRAAWARRKQSNL
jgi:xanthine dehydrogenase iron-sulfur cluster and FAD-binding subunit A